MACRVESRELSHNASWQDKENAFKKMFTVFKKQVAESGILHDYKQHEFYESPGRKARRKKKESERARLRENFPRRKPKGDYEKF